MINSELDIKSKFIEMCKLMFLNSEGKVVFPFDDLRHDDDYNDFINHNDWSILESKMNNLVELANTDIAVYEKDLETEIWEMI
jgi:hypothetical protein